MEIKNVRRPWQSQVKQGNRYNKDGFYHTSTWKQIRETHINGSTLMPDGFVLSNKYCVECYRNGKGLVPMHTVDHVKAIKMGGSATDPANLESLCKHDHAVKSSNEGKQKPGT